jgi:hypothetical protein
MATLKPQLGSPFEELPPDAQLHRIETIVLLSRQTAEAAAAHAQEALTYLSRYRELLKASRPGS